MLAVGSLNGNGAVWTKIFSDMTYEIKVLAQNGNVSSCNTVKGWRKDLRRCITAAQNFISGLADRGIREVRVSVADNGRTVYKWEYRPTIR